MFTAAEIFGSVGIGLVVVPFSSLLKKEHWDARIKVLIAIVVSTVFAIGGLASIGKLHNVNDIVTNAALVFSSATAFYKLYFSYTNVESLLASIGSKKVNSVVAPVDTAKLTEAVNKAAAAVTDTTVVADTNASVTVTKADTPVAESGPQPGASGTPTI